MIAEETSNNATRPDKSSNDGNCWVRQTTVKNQQDAKKWLQFKLLGQKVENITVFVKGVATCGWCQACESAEQNLDQTNSIGVQFRIEFTSFSARMNEHDGSVKEKKTTSWSKYPVSGEIPSAKL